MSNLGQILPFAKNFLDDVGAKVVAESGIPSDKYHLGKLVLHGLKAAPDYVLQIDGGTGESETFGSVLERSVRCATCFKNLGLEYADTIYIIAKNHIHFSIPIYAALYQGLIVGLNDGTFGIEDMTESMKLINPKIVIYDDFCHDLIVKSIVQAGIQPKLVTFGERGSNFNNFLKKYSENVNLEEFRAADLDPEKSTCILLATSGSTGAPKAAELTHKNFIHGGANTWCYMEQFPSPTRMLVIYSPIMWFSTVIRVLFCPIMRVTGLQSSKPHTWEHYCELLKKYKPTYAMLGTAFLTTMIKSAKPGQLDMSSLEVIIVGGSFVSKDLLMEIKKQYPKMKVLTGLGMSESCGPVTLTCGEIPDDTTLTAMGSVEIKLVDPVTEDIIKEPNVNGEMWIKGPCVFKGYYKNPTATSECLTEDGWLKTGDILQRDKHGHYIYIERMKCLLKYYNYHVSPVEIENVISKHPGVVIAGVTGVYDENRGGDQAVACVVLKEGWQVTAQQIKDLVKESLSETKALRGGVAFLKELPLTPNAKIDRNRLKELVKTIERH